MEKEKYKWDIFLAHARADKAAAEQLYDLLEPHCRVFLDSRCLLLGDDWDQELASAQRHTLVSAVLVSPRTEQAYYQREEIAAAIDMARKDKDRHRVVPIYIDTEIDENLVPYGLRLKHGLSLSRTNGFQGAAQSLLDLLGRLKNKDLGIRPNSLHTQQQRPSTFTNLCKEIRALLNDNKRMFKSFGPNSGADSVDPVRWDLTLWEKAKVEVIVPNNREIAKLIKNHSDLVLDEHRATFDEMLAHIYAFEKHCEDPTFDYSEHQFPKGFAEIIDETCLAAMQNHPVLSAIEKWLRRELNSGELNVIEGFFTGSVLRDASKAADVDVVLLIADTTPGEIMASTPMLNSIKSSFQSEFKRLLHVNAFSKAEQEDFDQFATAVDYKRSLIEKREQNG